MVYIYIKNTLLFKTKAKKKRSLVMKVIIILSSIFSCYSFSKIRLPILNLNIKVSKNVVKLNENSIPKSSSTKVEILSGLVVALSSIPTSVAYSSIVCLNLNSNRKIELINF